MNKLAPNLAPKMSLRSVPSNKKKVPQVAATSAKKKKGTVSKKKDGDVFCRCSVCKKNDKLEHEGCYRSNRTERAHRQASAERRRQQEALADAAAAPPPLPPPAAMMLIDHDFVGDSFDDGDMGSLCQSKQQRSAACWLCSRCSLRCSSFCSSSSVRFRSARRR